MTHPDSPNILTRTVRFWINPDGSTSGNNSYSGKPSLSGFGHYFELDMSITGTPDPQTGYLIGIQHIDALVRDHLVEIIANRIEEAPSTHPAELIPKLWDRAQQEIQHPIHSINWRFSENLSFEMSSKEHTMNHVLYKERFEFAAAHRLHTDTMSNEENTQFFGKCNNPNGHGHNYKIEPRIRIPIDLLRSKSYQLEIQNLVETILLDQLDHKFLNTDCPWFDQSNDGVIPSIENIARVCFEQLEEPIAQLVDTDDSSSKIQLVSMCAWETEKTSSIYPG